MHAPAPEQSTCTREREGAHQAQIRREHPQNPSHSQRQSADCPVQTERDEDNVSSQGHTNMGGASVRREEVPD